MTGFRPVVINFRKRYVPDEQDWKGIRFLGRTLLERMRETARDQGVCDGSVGEGVSDSD